MDIQNELIVGVTPESKVVEPLQNKTLLESALFLRGYGFNVIPVVAKEPIGYWKKLQDRPITFKEMEGFKWDGATGIAIIQGVGNIRCLDIDVMADESILLECLSLMGLPSDYQWVERSGFGSHIFFLCTDNPEFTVEKRGITDGRADHFEKRWSHCYTVVSPSKHFDKQTPPQPTGKTYRWLYDTPTSKIASITEAQFNRAYEAVFTRALPKKAKDENVVPYDMSTPLGQAIAKFDIVKYCDEHGNAHTVEPNGDIRIEYAEGHNSLLWWTGKASSHWMSNSQGLNCLETIVFLESKGTSTDFDGMSAEQKKNIIQIIEKNTGISTEAKLMLEPEVLITEDQKFMDEVIFRADSIGDLPDPVAWIVKDVMATEECFGLFGLPGEGKSYAALQLAISVASGTEKEWLGFTIEKQGSVLYILNDGSMTSLKNRIRCISNYLHIPKPNDLMILKKQGVFESWKESVERIINIAHPILIVVDSLSMVANSKDENSVAEQIKFGGLLNDWALNHKLNVLTIHHSNKASADRTMGLVNWRGSSYWSGMLSSMMEFRKVGEHNKYKLVKSRDGGEDAQGVRECAYQKGVRKDGSYDLGGVNAPSGYKYIGKAEETIPGSPAKVGKPKTIFPKLDDIFSPGEVKTSKQAREAIMLKYGCKKDLALKTLKEWVDEGDVLRSEAKTGGVSYERKS